MTVTARANDMAHDAIRQNVYDMLNDFITQRLDQRLNPLKLIDSSIDGFTTELEHHLTVGESIVELSEDDLELLCPVVEKVSLVEQHLQNHRSSISQLFEGQHHARHQESGLDFDGAQSPVSSRGASGVAASVEVGSSVCQNLPSIPTNIRSPGTILEGSKKPDAPGNNIARDDMQRDSQPRNDTRQGSRLHTSDLI
ncbi:uncharacterized protein N7506_005647 [Penicillium brevicompactum]|uniref:uncharacterized protein n=1 Tax=Penicillium brevicompactum TaxID=5074 RepID=UPI0025401822|nr:uncharacterized protein N7506_005647 [Penicillium brevicompactum]KAJ5335711.1 hypothetical protein N7506_005647 [Penicillium brevicompactum]